MRLQLSLLAVALLARGAAAGDDPDERGASGSLSVYADDDHVTVVSPRASARVHARPWLALDTAILADAITGASVDVITSASPGTIHERRIEASEDATAALTPTLAVGGRANVSHEHDYDALHLALHGAIDLAKRNTTLAATYDEGRERAGSVIDPAFHASRATHRLLLTLTQVAGRRTYVDLIADVSRLHGYHASPYRTVVVEDPAMPSMTRLAEVTPVLRQEAALAVRVRHALADQLALHAAYRFYIDDWSIHSHTASADLLGERASGVRLGAGLRAYTQTGADFYRDRYSGMPSLRTRDRTLGPMRTAAVHATFDVPLTERGDGGPRLVGELGLLRFWFLDYTPQRDRTALTTTVGISSPF